jgi:CHASE3 domain sensor protein
MPGMLERVGRCLSPRTASLPLLSRLLIGSTVLAVLVGAAFALALVAMSDLRNATNAQAHSKEVSTATLELERIVNQLDSSLRGYVNSGNRSYLSAWREARRSLPSALAGIDGLVATQRAQVARAQELATANPCLLTEYGVPLIAIFRSAARRRARAMPRPKASFG